MGGSFVNVIQAVGCSQIKSNYWVISFPIPQEQNPSRPRVGETLDPDWTLPDAAFAPLSNVELKGWGL